MTAPAKLAVICVAASAPPSGNGWGLYAPPTPKWRPHTNTLPAVVQTMLNAAPAAIDMMLLTPATRANEARKVGTVATATPSWPTVTNAREPAKGVNDEREGG